MMYGDHMDGGGWALSILVTLLIVVLIVGLIVWLVHNQASSAPRRPDADGGIPARAVLDRRLAAGEIDEDAHRRLRSTLAQGPSPPPEKRVATYQ